MNITSVSSTQLYSIVTGRQMAWVNCDLKKAGEYSKEELLEMSAKNIDSSSIDSLVKSGVSFMDNMSISDDELGDFLGKMGRRIDDAYKAGTLSDEDYKTLCGEFDKYVDDAIYSVEYKRCAREASKPDGYSAAGIYSKLQIGDIGNKAREMMKKAEDGSQSWQVDKNALLERINMVRSIVINQPPKGFMGTDPENNVFNILKGENDGTASLNPSIRPLLKTGFGEYDYDFEYVKQVNDYIENGIDFSKMRTVSEMFMEKLGEVDFRLRMATVSAKPFDRDFIVKHISDIAKRLDKAYKDGIFDSREHKELNKQLLDYTNDLTNAFRRAEAKRECMLAESRRDPFSKKLYFALNDFEQIQADREAFVQNYLAAHPYDMRAIIDSINQMRNKE